MIIDEVIRVEIFDNEKFYWCYIWLWVYLIVFWGELLEWKGIVYIIILKVSIGSGM